MKKVRLEIPFCSNPLREAMQVKKIKWAFIKPIKGGYECITPFVLCRDYLKDLLFCKYVTEKPVGTIYGFNTGEYDFKDVSNKYTRLAVAGLPDDLNRIVEHFPRLHKMEEKWGLEKTKIVLIKNEEGKSFLIVRGDIKWQKSLLAFSFYSFIFRWFAYKDMQCEGDDINLSEKAEALEKLPSFDPILKPGFVPSIIKAYKEDRFCLSYLHDAYGLLYVGSTDGRLFGEKQGVYEHILQNG